MPVTPNAWLMHFWDANYPYKLLKPKVAGGWIIGEIKARQLIERNQLFRPGIWRHKY